MQQKKSPADIDQEYILANMYLKGQFDFLQLIKIC